VATTCRLPAARRSAVRPPRSVKSTPPSGRTARSHGRLSPVVRVVSLIPGVASAATAPATPGSDVARAAYPVVGSADPAAGAAPLHAAARTAAAAAVVVRVARRPAMPATLPRVRWVGPA